MIDFIRVKLINRLRIIHQLKSKDKYDLIGKYNYKTEKGEYPISSKTENLFIKITEKSAILENSLHKYFNIIKGKGNQNFNDFNFCDIQTALDILEKDNKYSLTDTSLTNLEFGFNIELDICPTKFLKNHVLMFDFKPPCYNPKNNPKMKINKFTYIEYEFKIYNKSLHYKSQDTFKGVLENKHILRIEVKYKSKKQLNKLGIFNLSDLKKTQVYNALIKDFFIKFDKLLIIDSFGGNSSMSKKERQIISNYTHPNYWIDLRSNKHSNTVTYHKKQFNKMIEKHKLNTWKTNLKRDVLNKFNCLMNTDCSRINNKLIKVA